MRNSSSLDWLRFMHTPNDYRVSRGLRDAASEMAAELADAQADRNKIRPCNF